MAFSTEQQILPEVQTLLDMLTYRRPHGSKGEADFIERFIEPYRQMHNGYYLGAYQNIVIEIPTADGAYSRTMFSCHTDTVHRNDDRQMPVYDPIMGVVYKDDNEPLGADDGAGVWLLLEMLRAGVPGTYVFHRGEERGGLGSGELATSHAAWLKGFDRAIAFDRRGTQDVITHQGMGRCCSNAFAIALAEALCFGKSGLAYRPDDGGIFTDTANYTELIPECTNVSVGYDGEHTGGEIQEVEHLLALRESCLVVDWEALPTERDPSVVERLSFDFDFRYAGTTDRVDFISGRQMAVDIEIVDLLAMNDRELNDFIYDYPDEATELMQQLLTHYASTVGE